MDRQEWSSLAGSDWSDAEKLYAHLSENTNIIHAARMMRWDEVLPEEAVVLDLGCGSGWLTGLLTRNRRVSRVIAWDFSLPLLSGVLPTMVGLVGGDIAKVDGVC